MGIVGRETDQEKNICFHWNKVYRLPVNSIRIFNAYGPRFQTKGAYGSVMGVFLKQKLSKKPLTVVGDGNQSRDYVHAKDVANAFYLAAILGSILESRSIKIKILFIPFYFCMMNYATIMGTFRYFKGKQSAAWEKSKRK